MNKTHAEKTTTPKQTNKQNLGLSHFHNIDIYHSYFFIIFHFVPLCYRKLQKGKAEKKFIRQFITLYDNFIFFRSSAHLYKRLLYIFQLYSVRILIRNESEESVNPSYYMKIFQGNLFFPYSSNCIQIIFTICIQSKKDLDASLFAHPTCFR